MNQKMASKSLSPKAYTVSVKKAETRELSKEKYMVTRATFINVELTIMALIRGTKPLNIKDLVLLHSLCNKLILA
jgi:hypothetical protein